MSATGSARKASCAAAAPEAVAPREPLLNPSQPGAQIASAPAPQEWHDAPHILEAAAASVIRLAVLLRTHENSPATAPAADSAPVGNLNPGQTDFPPHEVHRDTQITANTATIDPWTIVHFSTGLALGLMEVRHRWAITGSIADEFLEQAVERHRLGQEFFETHRPESLTNALTDSLALLAGHQLGRQWNRG